MASLYDLVENVIGDLPSMPIIVAKVLNLLENEAVPNLILADAVSHDPAIAARILSLVNSVSISTRGKVTSLDHAIGTIGRSTVRQIALESSIKNINAELGVLGVILWEESVSCAIASRIIAMELKVMNMDEAFVAGLFAPVGKVVLALKHGTLYQETLSTSLTSSKSLSDLEDEQFGLNHEIIAAALLEKWNMSPSLIQGILHCNDLKNDTNDQIGCLISRIVNLAIVFTKIIGNKNSAPLEIFSLDNIFTVHLLRTPQKPIIQLFEEFRVAFQNDQEYYLS
jgi:HD-like signal output (HDOD) protein